jgi:hypothetical protein
MTGRIGDDELTVWRGEIAVSHVNGDTLFPLRLESVGEQREVHLTVAGVLAGFLYRFKLDPRK